MSDDQVEPADAAAEAFEGLTSEISRLGVKVDALMAAAALKDATPDYALTLGAISQTLRTISAHPHISQSPESYQAQGLRAVEEARNLTRRDTDQIVQQFKAAAADLDRRGKAARERRAQLEWVLMAGALGLFLGVLVWGQGSGLIARALPPSWRIPETLAAATLNMDRWDAGARLMRVENPSEWAAILEGAKIERENRSALLTCWAAAQRAGRPQRCTISVTAGS